MQFSHKELPAKSVRRGQQLRRGGCSYSRRLRAESLEDRRLLANAPILDFAQSIGGMGSESAYDLTRDGAGNIYVAGDFSGNVDFDLGAGAYILNSNGPDAFVAKYAADGEFVWAKSLGVSNGYANFNGVTVDTLGNVFAGGSFSGDDGDSLFSVGQADGILVKFDANGNRLWTQSFGSTEYTAVNEVTTDGAGNVYMGGFFRSTVDFDAGPGTTLLTSPGDDSGFIAKLNSSGNLIWARDVSSDVSGESRVNQLALDSAGSLVATVQSSSAGGSLLKLDEAGTSTWVRSISSGQTDGIAIDSQDNIVASGLFQGMSDFDPGSGVFELTSSGSGPHSGFVWKLDSAGNFLWARAPDGGIISTAYKVAVDSADDVYVVGNYFGRTDMDPGLGTFYLEEPGGGDYVWKLDSAGNFAWARSSNAEENYAGVAVDNSGNVYLAPTFYGSVDFDPGPQGLVLTSQGYVDFAIVKLSQGVVVPINPLTIDEDLQDLVAAIQSGSNGVPTADILLSVTSTNLGIVIAAVEALSPNSSAQVVDIVINLSDGDYLGQTIDVPVGVRLVIDGTGSSVTFYGASPALWIQSGVVLVTGVTLVNTTDASTIVVSSGSLVLRNSLIRETTGGNRAAIEITGGNLDIGTADNLGGNTFDVSGAGDLIRNLSTSSVSSIGNVYQVDGSTLTNGFAIEDKVFHGLDVTGLGVVNYSGVNLFVGASGDLQNAVNVSQPNATLYVASGVTQSYNVGDKLLTIAFENGPTISQHADSIDSRLRTVTIIGTPEDDLISFLRGPRIGEIQAEISGTPTGTFRPNGRLIAFGEAGSDDMSIDGSIALNAVLYGGAGEDRLKGGRGHDTLLGDAGDDLLVGGDGRDLLIGGIGADRLVGNADDDILIAATTAFDAQDAALAAIMSEWTSSRSFTQRTANITGGTGAAFDRYNGNFFLNTSVTNGLITVHDDNAKDLLTGTSGQDWFFANLDLHGDDEAEQKDKITDLSASEFALDLDFIGL